MAKTLNTASEVIDALGGNVPTADITKRASPRVVSNWRRRGLPRETFIVITTELQRRGLEAQASIWGMAEPERQSA